MLTETVKGFSDYSGEEAEKREKIREILARNFQLYGFEPAETPIIEYEDFVKGENEYDEAVSSIFKLQDKGKRNLALRYELTFQLKRLAKNKKLPYKRYQIGEVFRDEPTSANRFRQFTQCDIDIIGSNAKDEAEVMALVSRVFKELGIDIVINVNSRKLMNEILEEQGITEKDRNNVIKEVDKADKLSEAEVKDNLKKYKAEGILAVFKKPAPYFKKYVAYSEILELERYCKMYDISVNFQPSLARGLSYYNGSVFEVKTAGMKETIAGGGSYIINGIQSTGISLGIERLSQLAKIKLENERILIISIKQDKKAIQLAEKLRKLEKSVVIMDKISKALEYANSRGIPYAVFVGEEEVKKKKFKLRDMKTGKEKMLSEKGIIEELKTA
ncbi:MAG TPA: ATP phosphoribosyltransferase regulatory subunit [Candidatus Nanoarchaeia archaeon]|nr:ATP phosphoribosyltransferase regulatory subunit [Candidatus Nanoarchaeia archaeon]